MWTMGCDPDDETKLEMHGGLESAIPMVANAIGADPPLNIEDADYSKTESEEIIGFPGDHYLNQMSKKGCTSTPEGPGVLQGHTE